MIPGERALRGAGMSRQVSFEPTPYRYRGRPGWVPGDAGSVPGAEQERAERDALFARFRESGVSAVASAAAMGLPPGAGTRLERRRRAGGAR